MWRPKIYFCPVLTVTCSTTILEPEVDTFSDLDTDATTEEVDDTDTEYMNDTAVIEG